MNRPDQADALTGLLSLDLPPVALARLDTPPGGDAGSARPAPPACALWRGTERGTERGVVRVEAAGHFACPAASAGFLSVTGVVHGPLADFPFEPDLVLLRLTPAQAVVYHEAARATTWSTEAAKVSGRPGCAALDLAMTAREPRTALVCTRPSTGAADDRLLAVVPGADVDELVAALRVAVVGDAAMKSFYDGRSALFGLR